MKSNSSTYFQCQICKTFVSTLWKVERHVKIHENLPGEGNERGLGDTRKRGMLPIKKILFPDCHVRVVRIEVEKYKHATEDKMQDGSVKRHRRNARLKAGEKIRHLASVSMELEVREQRRKSRHEDDDEQEFSLGKKGFKKVVVTNRKTKSKTTSRKDGLMKSWRKYRRPPKIGIENMLKCDFCPEKFGSKSALSKHRIESHSDQSKTIACVIPTCDQLFLGYFNLCQHLTFHCLAEKKAVDEAGKQEQKGDAGALEGNLSTEEDEKEQSVVFYRKKKPGQLKKYFFCKYCLRRWVTLHKLNAHIEKAHGPFSKEGLACPCCKVKESQSPLKFLFVHEYVKHVRKTHRERLNPFQEKRCWQSWPSVKNKLPRVERRRKRKPKSKDIPDPVNGTYTCDKCSKRYRDKYSFTRHREAHEDAEFEKTRLEEEKLKVVPCSFCEKRFTHKNQLNRHMNLHLADNPYVCDFPGCNKKSNSSYNLKRHRQMHIQKLNEEEKIQCPLCQRTFTRLDHFKRHLRSLHEPSDLTNLKEIPPKSKSRTCVKPLTKLLQTVGAPQENDSTPSDFHSDDDTDDKSAPVKNESPSADDDKLIEEIHLTDRIILGPYGEAIHVKGESLDPDIRVSNPSLFQLPTSTRKVPKTEVNGETDTFKINMTSLNAPASKSLNEFCKSKNGKAIPESVKRFNSQTYMALGKQRKCFPCTECKLSFSRAWTLQFHMSTYHKKTLLDKATESKEDNNALMLMCGFCARPVESSKELELHIKKMHPRRFQCHYKNCSTCFTDKRRLEKHLEMHKKSKEENKCSFCSKTFLRKEYARLHEKTVHHQNGDRKRVKCHICHKIYSAASMKPHLRRHEEAKKMARGEKVRRHKCMLCNDDFATITSLKRHIDAIHLGKSCNKGKKDVTKRVVKKTPSSSSKTEWYTPLLQKMGLMKPTEENCGSDQIHNGEGRETNNSVESQKGNSDPGESQLQDEAQASILGI